MQIRSHEAASRHVHVDRNIKPVRSTQRIRIRACLVENKILEHAGQTRVLRRRHELRGLDLADCRMLPASERLDSDSRPARKPDDRLILHFESAAGGIAGQHLRKNLVQRDFAGTMRLGLHLPSPVCGFFLALGKGDSWPDVGRPAMARG